MNTPSATRWERRQSHFVLGLLRRGERLPVLAWGMARGEGAREKGFRMGQVQGGNMGLGTGDMRGKGPEGWGQSQD